MHYYSYEKGRILNTNSIDTLILLLYEEKARLLTENEISESGLDKDYNNELRKKIASYDKRIPLYDIYSNRIYLIYRENVYPRINYDKYRFITKEFYESLKESDSDSVKFLQNYDIDVLEYTYLRIFYKSFVMNSYITNCKRPSFRSGLDHIEPYYSSRELYYLAYDLELLNSEKEPDLTDQEAGMLCKKIVAYDIPAKTLTDHQIHIFKSKAIGLVKHYSLFGSYFMNKYLRDYYCCFPDDPNRPNRDHIAIINDALEIQVKLMIRLIKSAPSFFTNKRKGGVGGEFTVYRFIENDIFLRGVQVGDVYQDPSFMSTTRNPFYYQENYQFGYILMKIRIPINVPGIGLCIESYSNFPKEEEIIFPPTSRFKLERITEEQEQHVHVIGKRVAKRYEFTLLGNDYQNTNDIVLKIPNGYEPEIPLVDMSSMVNNPDIAYTSIADRLKFFTRNHVNTNFQFKTPIGTNDSNRVLTFIMESYDSTSVYKDFFYYTTNTGVLIYSFNPKYGNINIMIELDTEMHVNYYFKYSVTDSSHQLNLDDKDWIDWLSHLSYTIGSRNIVIHADYRLHYIDTNDDGNKKDIDDLMIMKTRYTYSENIYQYLKFGKKYFKDFPEIIPGFEYYLLDGLKYYTISDLLNSTDKDELYQIAVKNSVQNVHDMYILVVEKYPKFLPILESKMYRVYRVEKNPFENVYYTLDSWAYLYNRGIIKSIPSEKEFGKGMKRGSFKSLIGDKKIPQFKNRLRTYLQKIN